MGVTPDKLHNNVWNTRVIALRDTKLALRLGTLPTYYQYKNHLRECVFARTGVWNLQVGEKFTVGVTSDRGSPLRLDSLAPGFEEWCDRRQSF